MCIPAETSMLERHRCVTRRVEHMLWRELELEEAMTTPEELVEEISKLSVEQLLQVKEQVDGEVSVLQDSLTNVRTAANRLEMASKALSLLSTQPAGKKMLVPLTASLYASGTLANTDNVLVDVGTGYFIEGKDYCERKIKILKENHQKLAEVARGKQNTAEQVNMVLQAKMRQGATSSQPQRA